MDVIEIKNYSYYLFASRINAAPYIALYDANEKHVAYVQFNTPSPDLKVSKKTSAGKYILYYDRAVFNEVLDLLRNESPIYLHWSPESPNNTRLATTLEEIGEEES